MPWIDTNVYLGTWPFRALESAPDALAGLLASHGVHQAWTGSFDALLHKDVARVNARLATACAESGGGMLVPFGALNPALPDWEDDLRRCAEAHGMPGIRLHPNYHGYGLEEPRFVHLLELSVTHGLAVQIAVSMEDERMMHPLVQVPHVDVAPLPAAIAQVPEARVMLLNAFRAVRGQALRDVARDRRIVFDIAWLEGLEGIRAVSDTVGVDRLVFGSHAPYFYFEAAALKLVESPLSEEERAAVCGGTAARWLDRGGTR